MAKQLHRVYQSGWLDVRKPAMKQPPVNQDIVANDVPSVELARYLRLNLVKHRRLTQGVIGEAR